MNGKAGNGRSHRASILLVDDDSRMRNLRAVVLSTHGYDVDSASNAVEAQSAWGATRPDLVLVAFSRYRAGTLEFLERIKRLRPQQRIAFVNSESLHLSPLFYNGELIRKAEGPEDFIEQVESLCPDQCTRWQAPCSSKEVEASERRELVSRVQLTKVWIPDGSS